MPWSERSLKELKGVHPDLVKVCNLALMMANRVGRDFMIIDGVRTREEQLQHYKSGASKTMRSRHIHGFAVDFMALFMGKGRWEPIHYKPIGVHFKQAALELGIPIIWGGDWKWKDWGHIELDKKVYPDP